MSNPTEAFVKGFFVFFLGSRMEARNLLQDVIVWWGNKCCTELGETGLLCSNVFFSNSVCLTCSTPSPADTNAKWNLVYLSIYIDIHRRSLILYITDKVWCVCVGRAQREERGENSRFLQEGKCFWEQCGIKVQTVTSDTECRFLLKSTYCATALVRVHGHK